MTLTITKKLTRFWEIDALRGVAVILMVFYHLVWDLSYFGYYQANLLGGPWQTFARSIGSTFIFLAGLSLTLSDTRHQQRTGQPAPFTKYLRRGAEIFGFGLAITVATYFFIGRGFVIFGILHLLGASIILAYPFLRLGRWVSLAAGLLLIGLGIYLDGLVVSFPWLIWLGIKQQDIYMVDYYPLLPWFGLSLLGIFVGYTLYPRGTPRLALPNLNPTLPVRGLRWLGQHSLPIYLIHQPVLLTLLMGFNFIFRGVVTS